MKVTLYIIGVLIVLFILYLNSKDVRMRKKILNKNKNRPHLKKNKYIERLIQKGFEKEHIEIFYNESQKIIGIKSFTMYPEDDIYENYGLWDLDDLDLIDSICAKLGIRKAEQEDLDELGKIFKSMNAESILTLINRLKNTESTSYKTKQASKF